MSCKFCKHFDEEEEVCSECIGYELDEKKFFQQNVFDIFSLDDDVEWSHIQIMEQLKNHGIECTFVDIFINDNMAWILGCNERDDRIARALNIHKDCIYNDYEHCVVFLNLFQEKYLRGMLNDGNDC